jgi:hypothetical protein
MFSSPVHPGRLCPALAACLALAGCAQPLVTAAVEEKTRERTYELLYTAEFEKGSSIAAVSIGTGRDARRFRQLRFDFDPGRYSDFRGDGELVVDDGELVWRPPRDGGTLRYRVRVPHQRVNGSYDAYVADDWALFRGGDLFPPATTRAVVGAKSLARLRFVLPEGWSAITPYLTGDGDLEFDVVNRERRFDRPTGWMLVGEMGVRRGRIAGRRVAIAAPKGEDFRRMDMMAFLNWTLPAVTRIFPTMDPRLVIIGAGDPMWRGGLSGPGSLFVHADRPLISENGTSTFLHELVHVAMGAAGPEHDDWLLEGLAEYYSIKILRISGSLNGRRMTLALRDLDDWGAGVDDLFVRHATGPVTARATTLLAALDKSLTADSPDGRGLDAVVAVMIENGGIYDYESLCTAANTVMRGPVPILDPSRVPGAPDVAACRAD